MKPFRVVKTDRCQQVMGVGALWIFAVAQPLLSLLSDKQHTQFFLAHGAKGPDIVLFVFLLSCLVPLLVAVIAWLSSKWNPRLYALLHPGLVFLLWLLLALPLVKALIPQLDWIIVLVSTLLAVGLTVFYRRQPDFRMYLGWLGLAVVLAPLFFLLLTPLRKLAFPKAVHSITPPAIEAQIPVVLLVFDELPLSSLLNQQGAIDAEHFPNFAALSRQSTWYRNALTVADRTSFAVPIILSSRLPNTFRPGTYAGYPDNLFTLMEKSYQVAAVECLTEMCPERLCPPADRQSLWKRQADLMADLKIVYLHLILPRGLAAGLPSVDKDWANFGEAKAAMQSRNQFFERFMALLDSPHPDRTLYMMHLELPHSPWIYYPSGKQYDAGTNPEAIFFGIKSTHTTQHRYQYKSWENDWARTQGFQRHLMQLQYTDGLLGKTLERLKRKGLFDKALIIVVADHGISFHLKGDTRSVGPDNDASILPVPMFVKYPAQRQPIVSEIPALTTDIMPTIADVLGIKIPWPVDGVSLRQSPFPSRKAVTAYGRDLETFTVSRATLQTHRGDPLLLKTRLFSRQVPGFEQLYAIGPYPALLGKSPTTWETGVDSSISARLLEPASLRQVDLQGSFLPGFQLGELTFKDGKTLSEVDLALSLNGRIVALSRAYPQTQGRVSRFYFIVPESAFKAGRNDAQIYKVSRQKGKTILSRLSK